MGVQGSVGQVLGRVAAARRLRDFVMGRLMVANLLCAREGRHFFLFFEGASPPKFYDLERHRDVELSPSLTSNVSYYVRDLCAANF